MKPRTTEWLSKARGDLRVAEVVYAEGDSSLLDYVGFHYQQAVEKALKAFLVEHGVGFQPSHDLQYLLDLCISVEAGFDTLAPEIEGLQPYAVRARYPSDLPASPSAEVIEGFLSATRRVIETVSATVRDVR